jgi:hypothetical protein
MLSERDPHAPRRMLKGAKTMQGSLFRHVPVSHKPHLGGQSRNMLAPPCPAKSTRLIIGLDAVALLLSVPSTLYMLCSFT